LTTGADVAGTVIVIHGRWTKLNDPIQYLYSKHS